MSDCGIVMSGTAGFVASSVRSGADAVPGGVTAGAGASAVGSGAFFEHAVRRKAIDARARGRTRLRSME
jgi:hypothetical protein